MPWAEQPPRLSRKAFWSPFHFQPCVNMSSVNAGGRETISEWVMMSWFCISGCLVTTLCKLRVVHCKVPRRVTQSPDSQTWIWLVQKVGLAEAASLLGSHPPSSVPSTYLSLLAALTDFLPSPWSCDHVQPCDLQPLAALDHLLLPQHGVLIVPSLILCALSFFHSLDLPFTCLILPLLESTHVTGGRVLGKGFSALLFCSSLCLVSLPPNP